MFVTARGMHKVYHAFAVDCNSLHCMHSAKRLMLYSFCISVFPLQNVCLAHWIICTVDM